MMAETKVTLQTIVQDEELKKLNEELAKGQQEVKAMEQALRQMEKATNKGADATAEQAEAMKKLRQEINMHKQANTALNREINNGIKTMQGSGQAAKSLADNLKDIAKVNFGIDLGGLKNINLSLVGIASSAIAVGAALVKSGNDLSKFSNQFISFAGNARSAKDMYDKFNEVYRNTNYDEQKVYDMAKALMAVGINADEAADLISKCADTSASLGKGADFAEELTRCFERLATGGELTEKQYKALAEAGIDLSNVQDEMRAGGTTAYEALKNKLAEYEGGMANAKQTAAEMEGDIKGNFVEIGRQTAALVDEIFGFSEGLRGFYQWVIDITQACIDSIKNMISAFRRAKAAADDYADAMAAYGEIDEDNTEEVQKRAAWVEERVKLMEAERKEAEALEKQYEGLGKARVESIAKSSGGGSSGGGSSKDTTGKDNSSDYRELVQSQKQLLSNAQAEFALKQKIRDISQQISVIGVSDSKRIREDGMYAVEAIQKQLDFETELHDKRMSQYEEQIEYLEAHPFNGSDKILANLQQQMEQEEAIYELKKNSLEKEIELKSKLTAEAQNQKDSELNTVQKYWENYAKGVSSSMGQAVAAVINGNKTMGEAMKDMLKQMIANALAMLAQWVSLVAIFAAFGDPTPARHASILMFGNDGTYVKEGNAYTKRKATGGYITGAGTATSDSIPAMLSNGEYVLNSRAVDNLGTGYLDALNAGMNPVENSQPVGGSSVTLNVSTMDANSFGDFLGRGGLDSIKQALFEDGRQFGSMVGVW